MLLSGNRLYFGVERADSDVLGVVHVGSVQSVGLVDVYDVFFCVMDVVVRFVVVLFALMLLLGDGCVVVLVFLQLRWLVEGSVVAGVMYAVGVLYA